ncbi:MAG: hypothetical protein WAW41_04210 [Methylobacter sp.]
MTEEQEHLVEALHGANEGICCALEHGTITPTQIFFLLDTLIKQLATTLH